MQQFRNLDNQNVTVMGRVHWQSSIAIFGYPGVTFGFVTDAQQAYITAKSIYGKGRLDVYLDGKLAKQWVITATEKQYPLLGKSKARPVTVKIINRGETWHGVISISGLQLKDGTLLPPETRPKRKLLIIGDSVSCGALMGRNSASVKGPQLSNAAQSYAMLLADQLNAQAHLVCYGGRGLIRSWDGNIKDVQAPDFFEQTVPSGENAPLWDHQAYIPDGILVSLGTNDFNLGIPDKARFVTSYTKFITRLLTLYPHAHIFLTEGAMLNDNDPSVAKKTIAQAYLKLIVAQTNRVNVSYIASLHYSGDECDPHPTEFQHQQMARDLKEPIKAKLGW